MISIEPARVPQDRHAVIDIWREYTASPKTSLAYQRNEAEFADLPGIYAAPDGCIVLARTGENILGCIAFRRVDTAICEMKRLYVRPHGRGSGLGRRLVALLIDEARRVGYTEMRLDVLQEFAAAQSFYAAFGFAEAPPVTTNPIAGTRFLGLVF